MDHIQGDCPAAQGRSEERRVGKECRSLCDWSSDVCSSDLFDLEGGGCFNRECGDLETFPVDVRQEEIWIQLGDPQYKRRDEHLRLLWEGLLSEDRWTISKAIALLLKGDRKSVV